MARDAASGNQPRLRSFRLYRTGSGAPRVRDVRWFPDIGSPLLYLVGVLGVPLVIGLTALLDLPKALAGPFLFAAGFPCFEMSRAVGRRLAPMPPSWTGAAQMWLQMGGAVPAALRAIRRRDRPTPGRHEVRGDGDG